MTPNWKKRNSGSEWGWKPDAGFLLQSERRQCPSLNTKSKSLSAPVKSSPNIGEHWKDLKGIGSVFLSPTDATMHEQLFELESVLSESSHVCPTDWMSCIREGFKTLFSITFKCSVFWELPLCNKSPCEALMIGVNSSRGNYLRGKSENFVSAAILFLSLLLCHPFIYALRLKQKSHLGLLIIVYLLPFASCSLYFYLHLVWCITFFFSNRL